MEREKLERSMENIYRVKTEEIGRRERKKMRNEERGPKEKKRQNKQMERRMIKKKTEKYKE